MPFSVYFLILLNSKLVEIIQQIFLLFSRIYHFSMKESMGLYIYIYRERERENCV